MKVVIDSFSELSNRISWQARGVGMMPVARTAAMWLCPICVRGGPRYSFLRANIAQRRQGEQDVGVQFKVHIVIAIVHIDIAIVLQ